MDLSRFDAGGIEVEETIFRLDEMLERVIDGLRPDAESKTLRIQVSGPQCSVCSDRLLVERVLSNLLTNAIRYTNEGSITVTTTAISGSTIEVSIAYTGIGIASEDQERVFDDYAQLHNPARSREKGAGLGLAIIERIDKLLGLDLRMHSTLGVGSEFVFRLPLSDHSAAGPAPLPEEEYTEGYPDLRVWVIEDDPDVAEAFEEQLKSWGCSVFMAKNRTEIECESEKTGVWPDVIFIDDMLPDGEQGLDIAKLLIQHLDQDRIIVLTGNVDRKRQSEIQDSGFRLVVKPAHPDLLRQIIVSIGKQG